MKLVSVSEMKAIEKEANRRGMPYEEMMRQAGTGLAHEIEVRFTLFKDSPVIGLIGGGNNGGDALIALTLLQMNGWNTTALLLKERLDDPLLSQYEKTGGKTINTDSNHFSKQAADAVRSAGIILDRAVGTGITLPLKEDAAYFLAAVKENLLGHVVVAVDCPSGVDCDNGNAAPQTLKATLTICMECVKTGLVRFPAFEYCGEIVTIPIGLESVKTPELSQREVIDDLWVQKRLPERPITAHKGTFGSVLVVGGSVNFVGAPLLSARAAYRSGSGLVSLAIPQSIHSILAGQLPEAIWLVLDDEGGVISDSAAELVISQLGRVDALVLGPGIGREDTTSRFLDMLFSISNAGNRNRRIGFLKDDGEIPKQDSKLPTLVLDADGLRWLALQENWNEKIRTSMVLTPHPGEMSALTGLTVEEIQSERMGIASLYSKKWDQVVVLKGALTVVAAPDDRLAIIPVASSALAKAGSGDVLSGIIASLLGQGMKPYEAACVGAWIHGRAGLKAAEKCDSAASVLATDIIDSIPDVFGALNKNTAL